MGGESLDYYRKYVGDYARDTARLSMLEHGAYNLLLDHYYAEEKPLPLDRDEIHRIVRAVKPIEEQAITKILETFFYKAADGWHHKRVDAEISKAGQARLNGRRGGRSTASVDDLLITGTGSCPPGSENGTGDGTHAEPYQPPASNHQPPTANPQGRAIALPAWLPPLAWKDYCEHRAKIKKPMTRRAAGLAIETLDKLRASGHSPQLVIDQSIEKGWTGLFELKQAKGGDGRATALESSNFSRARNWADRST